MTAHEAASHLSEWLEEDIEVAQDAATAMPPSAQQRLLEELFRQLLDKDAQGDAAIKFLGIAQAVLSGSFPFVDEVEAARRFEELLAFSATDGSREIRERVFTVAALLLNRVRDQLAHLPAATFALLDNALTDNASLREKAVLSAIRERLQAAALRNREARSQSGRKFNVPALDVSTAAKNVQEDVKGDWYQDPWGWPELDWLGRASRTVMGRLQSDVCSWTVPIDVSKRGGGVRPGIVINPLDRVAFQSLVDELSIEAAGDLPEWVHGWRLGRTTRTKGVYESNKSEWKLFSRRVVVLCKRFRFTAHLDIQSFFSTVDTSRLLAQLGRRYRKAAILDRLEAYLEVWHRRQNGSGIPQRSLASSVLAHAVLRPLDVFLDRMNDGGRSASFVATRWMDDIWLHSNNEELLRETVAETEGILAQLRLSLNAEKTEVFESKDAGKFVQLVDVGYGEMEESRVNLKDLLERAEGAPPGFEIGLKVARMLSRGDFASLAEISVDRLSKLTYLADRLAKVFRASGEWRRSLLPILILRGATCREKTCR